MSPSIRIGVLTPSSNTVLEPFTSRIVTGLDNVSAHFSRFTVTEISMSDDSFQQFDDSNILFAAELLAHAKVDAIPWSGTSASWLGFDVDEKLCERIQSVTGIKTTTSVLALNELLKINNIRSLGLVSPYLPDIQNKIIGNYAEIGVEIVSERHLGIQDNFSFGCVTEEEIMQLIREVSQGKPDAITTMCTNLRGTALAEATETQCGMPLYDSVSTVIWKSLKLADYDTSTVKGWGNLFES